MKRTLSTIEIILTVILVVVYSFSIGYFVENRVNKNSGHLTVENYSDYIDVVGSLSGLYTSIYDNSAETSYSVEIISKFYLITSLNVTYDVFITISINGKTENFSLTGQTVSVHKLEAADVYTTDKLPITIPVPAGTSSIDFLYNKIDIELTVTAVSGAYEYRLA